MADRLSIEITKLRTLTQLMMPNFGRSSKPHDLDAEFKKLREMTTELEDATITRITPRLLKTFALILDNIESVGIIVDKNCNVLYINKIAQQRAPKMRVGDKCYAGLEHDSHDNPSCQQECKARDVLKSKKPAIYPYLSRLTGIEYNNIAIPLLINHAKSLVMIIASRKEP